MQDDYQPLSKSKRRKVALLGLATSIGLILMLIYRPGFVAPPRVAPLSPPGPAVCGAGQSEGCVGGTVQVINAPAVAGSAARP